VLCWRALKRAFRVFLEINSPARKRRYIKNKLNIKKSLKSLNFEKL
jgi:hypothetical protein